MFKKLLIIILAIAVYLHFYPNEEVNSWFSSKKDMASEKFSEIADTKVQVLPSILLKDMNTDFKKFSKLEKEYVESIVVDRSTITEFSNDYCGDTTKKNSNLRTKNVKIVCEKIVQHRIFR